MRSIRTALTIAGSDSGGGAGIQADLKTFSAFGVFGMTAITSVTAQNTQKVLGIHDLPASFVALQLEAILSDLPVDATKTGMLSTADIIGKVAQKIRQHRLKHLVVDPVMVAKSGHRLLLNDALKALQEELLPLATVVTPNLHEAEALSGKRVSRIEDMPEAAEAIFRLGPRYVLIKGGHLPGKAVDILYNGKTLVEYPAERIETPHTHGTGCTFSAAIAAGLAKGQSVPDAVASAKEFVTQAIRNALPLGHGHGPLNHLIRPGNHP